MNEPVAVDGPLEARQRTLRAVPLRVQAGDENSEWLADELAAALRAIRGYVPNHIWWEAGPAQELLAYQALHGT